MRPLTTVQQSYPFVFFCVFFGDVPNHGLQASPNGNPAGPWTHYTDIFPNRTRVAVSWAATTATNPAVIFTKNGSVLMAFHGKDIGGEVPGIAHADSFGGPFRVLNPDPIFAAPAQFVAPNGTAGVGVFRGEDFFLWAGKRGLHLLWHVKQPFSTLTSTS